MGFCTIKCRRFLLSPCDYDLFTQVKGPLRGTLYNTRDELNRAIGRSGAKGQYVVLWVFFLLIEVNHQNRKCHLYLPRPIHACPRHGSWATLLAAKSYKVEGASSRRSKMGIYQLRETTLTENIVLPGLLDVGIVPTTQSVKNNSYEI